MPFEKPYIVGIDLGTTNSAVSYIDMTSEKTEGRGIKLFTIPQLTGPGEFGSSNVLPSFLYIPGQYDIAKESITIPWKTTDDAFVGVYARDHGAKVPARLVSSAKSWLCHGDVDRKSRILPWGAGDEIYKVSPVQATAAYLTHIRHAWNSTRGDDVDLYLENQKIIITVPASFDEVARELTLEAAAIAGLTESVTLIEEPLAAFYCWLIHYEQRWKDFVSPGELILVCDVGGGTTDFTLISLRDVDGQPRFERIAVGDHLILGGDNIDLTLARHVEMGIEKDGKGGRKGRSLSKDRWKALCHQCRQAKEAILGGESETKKITLVGEGKKLISDTISARLERKAVEQIVLEGFFPMVSREASVRKTERSAITEFGLPYEPEPAITRHLGWFLERHRDAVEQQLGKANPLPDHILFNGGSLKPEIIRERIRDAVGHWFGVEQEVFPDILENRNLDLSVALGASYYGLVKIGMGVRVGSGSSRSYYLGIDVSDGSPSATASKSSSDDVRHAVCFVERGLEEGSHIELEDRSFEVLANRPVSFDTYSSSYRSGDRCGNIVKVDDTMTPLPPFQTIIKYGKKGARKQIPIHLEADYTEMGTLALWCRSLISDHRWKLQFQLRGGDTAAPVNDREVFDSSVIESVRTLIQNAFSSDANEKTLAALPKTIVEVTETAKERWPLGLIRTMADELLRIMDRRVMSMAHESRWMNLLGFCLRPGIGDGFDEHRVQKLWKIYKKGTVHTKNAQVRLEWWIMWRRVAGGLNAGRQKQFIQDLNPVLLTAKGPGPKPGGQEIVEIWMAAANMERLLVKDKVKLGRRLVSEIQKKKFNPKYLWALSRFGARQLLYGPADRVIPPDEVADWIHQMVKKKWPDSKPVGTALVQIARKTGDRTKDLDPPALNRLIDWFYENGFKQQDIRPLKEIVPIAESEQGEIFGESLPSGLILQQ